MNEWCVRHHGASGLTERARTSKISLQAGEELIVQFLREHLGAKETALIAGSSVHVDLSFIKKDLPRVADFLSSYRVLDVSTVKELAYRWFPDACARAPSKGYEHTALADIRESISELKFFREAIFKPTEAVSAAGGVGGGSHHTYQSRAVSGGTRNGPGKKGRK